MFKQKEMHLTRQSEEMAEKKEEGHANKEFTNSLEVISFKEESPKKRSPFLGLFYTIFTSIFITLTSVFVKKLPYISPGYLSFVRNAGVLAGCLPIAVCCTKNVFGVKRERLLLVIRGFVGATALYLNLTAYRYLPLAEAAIIMSTLPALTTVVARIYLKEPCGVVDSFSLVITLVGVLISVRLPELLSENKKNSFDYFYLMGLLSAIGFVVLLCFTFVSLRKIKDIHFSTPLVYFGFIGMMENGIIDGTTSTLVYPRCGLDQILIILIGVFGFVGHCTLTKAIQAEAVGLISIIKASADIIVAMVFQIIFFNGNLDAYSISGACLVLFSVSIIGFKNWLLTLSEESKMRRRFRYILL